MTKMFDEQWMCDHGLKEPANHGDLRDFISQGDTVCVQPNDTLLTAYNRMRTHGFSQLPVLADQSILGIIDEWDLLKAMNGDKANFKRSVGEVMSCELETLPPDVPTGKLISLFDRNRGPIIVENGVFLGLITKIDYLNYLRRQAA